ncbi:MAG TPA: hypothetical protein PLU25_04535 [Acidobacteriota bacterium]|nr:hypothetical protein [Acidobacteriota bacterium]
MARIQAVDESGRRVLLTLLIMLAGIGGIATAAVGSALVRTIPDFSVSPALIPVDSTSDAFLCLSNSYNARYASFQPGDTFTFTFDTGCGQLVHVEPAVYINSATLRSVDFTVQANLSRNQIVMKYRGLIKAYEPGDSVCIRITLQTDPFVGQGVVEVVWRYASEPTTSVTAEAEETAEAAEATRSKTPRPTPTGTVKPHDDADDNDADEDNDGDRDGDRDGDHKGASPSPTRTATATATATPDRSRTRR